MSEHISAVEAQALLDAATPGPWAIEGPDVDLWVMDAGRSYSIAMLGSRAVDDEVDGNAELIAAAPRLAAEVVRLRRELDARTDPELAARLRRASAHGICRVVDLSTAARLLGGGE